MKTLAFYFIFLLCSSGLWAQKQPYKVAVAAFYNCENFYDTIDNPTVNDDDFLPNGPKHYTSQVYLDKVNKLASVISQIGTDITPDGPAFIGLAEVENDTVLRDLVNNPQLQKRNYQIIHYDSHDPRGVDVGFLYNPKYLTIENSNKLFVQMPGGAKETYFTRDILWVKGKLDGETIYIYVNHWPSRVGGEERSAPGRAAAARVCKQHMDSILNAEPNAKVIIMGDLNDDPVSASVAVVLNAKEKADEVGKGGLFNPWITPYKNGIGTLAFNDAWGLFDQIIISYAWLNKQQNGFFFYKQGVFNKAFLTENTGRYKGYPMRTWDGNNYRGGYSDHFPTYVIFLKKVAPRS
jgi:hypothetical protein